MGAIRQFKRKLERDDKLVREYVNKKGEVVGHGKIFDKKGIAKKDRYPQGCKVRWIYI